MISSVLALVAAASAAQSDTTRSSREAFTACLRNFVDHSVGERMNLEAFRAAYPQQCAAQEIAFREAIIRRDTAMRATRASAQESAQLEVDDARTNFADRFEASLPATPATATAAAPAPAASATPAATPASATTTATEPPTS
jgi:hypothetical protein